MTKILEMLHGVVWGAPALILILGVGIYLTVRTGCAQIVLFPRALGCFLRSLLPRNRSTQGVSSFQALCTALAATVGTGNLVGVAGALCLGGPGAIFWMWVCGLLGMATKFAEVMLAIRYRACQNGELLGGPMYMISGGMGKRWSWLARCYCIFGVIAAFGVGNATQMNAVISGINGVLFRLGGRESAFQNGVIGLILAILVGAMFLGGARRIGETAEFLVPFASVTYIVLCLGILLLRHEQIPGAIGNILSGAFSPRAVTGGLIGSVFQALKVGCSRGVFTNEAGMGTASIAHASAQVEHPGEQAVMGIMEVFLDTLVICTLTALAILVSGFPVPYGTDAGSTLTCDVFTWIYGDWAAVVIALCLCCFAFATVLGWGLYGARCAQFLFGGKIWNLFALLQAAAVLFGTLVKTETVWLLSETVNGLMAIVNMIALAALTPELVRLTIDYKKRHLYSQRR